MSGYISEDFVKIIVSIEENNTFARSVFLTPQELLIALAIIVSAIIVFSLIFVAKKKRATDSVQRFKEVPETNSENTSDGETETPQPTMELEELKGIGTKTAEKLKAINIMNVSDLAKASAHVLSQKTGISKKLLSKWIEQANAYKIAEN